MMLKNKKTWLLMWALQLLFSTTALAQEYFDYDKPGEFEPFAPPELSGYGGGPKPNEGFYVSMDYLNWAITPAQRSLVGTPGLTHEYFDPLAGTHVQNSDFTTAGFSADFTSGGQYEVGYIEDEKGWFVRGFNMHNQNQTISSSDVDVVFEDPPNGALGLGYLDRFLDFEIAGYVLDNIGDGFDDDLDRDGIFGRSGQDTDADGTPDLFVAVPVDIGDARKMRVVFDEVELKNVTQMKGLEWMLFRRASRSSYVFEKTSKRGWVWEAGLGIRYLRITDDFFGNMYGGYLADTNWYTQADNNIVGPQLMLRGNKQMGRFGVQFESRYMAGFNFQNVNQKGVIGSNLDQNDILIRDQFGSGWGFGNTFHANEYSPLYELKATVSYQVTKALRVHGGWQGFFVDGLARGSSMNEYRLPRFGIKESENRQGMFANGFVAGLEFNR